MCGGGKAKAMSDQELSVVRLQTVFVNNPFLGMLIMVGIFIGHIEAGIGCAVGWYCQDYPLSVW